jgi:phosphoribosyl-ATP pyrophosphohydrolase/phosphoribosyl-AMP cyclohydrolase
MNIQEIKYDPTTKLVPAIIQDYRTRKVLMQAYMNEASLEKTIATKQVCFFSRSRNTLWTKGETSGNFLDLVSIKQDCDNDSLLLQVIPKGPTCHTGSDTCWNESNDQVLSFLVDLQSIIKNRKENPTEESYVSELFRKGINKIAQKVGEEAVETVIEAKDNNDNLFLNESADLLFHLMVLLEAKGKGIEDVVSVLRAREKK